MATKPSNRAAKPAATNTPAQPQEEVKTEPVVTPEPEQAAAETPAVEPEAVEPQPQETAQVDPDFIAPTMDEFDRIEVGMPDKLPHIQIPGYQTRWTADYDSTGNFMRYRQRQGYAFVSRNEVRDSQLLHQCGMPTQLSGEKITCPGGRGADGKPITMYLMKIRDEVYDMRQAKKDADRNKIKEQIFGERQALDPKNPGAQDPSAFISGTVSRTEGVPV